MASNPHFVSDELGVCDLMEQSESGLAALIVGLTISMLGALLVVLIAALELGHLAFHATLNGAPRQVVFLAINSLSSSPAFLLPLIILGLTVVAAAGFASTK